VDPLLRRDKRVRGKGNYSLPPKEKHWQDHSHFIRNIVERYDGDGLKDMPGLRYPILHYEIESEAQGSAFWRGTATEYIELLKRTYIAAKKANPKVKIILNGFWLGDVVHPDEELEKRIQMIDEAKGFKKSSWHKYAAFFRAVLQEKDYFDLVEIHSLEDYPMIFTAVGWLKKMMKLNGYHKPIWVGDATAVPTLHYGPITPHPTPFSMDAGEILKILANKRHLKYRKLNAWYRAEQSRLVVKKSVAAMAMGVEKINFGFFSDNLKLLGKPLKSKLLAKLNPLGYNWSIAGFLGKNYQPYPAFYTYKLTVEKLRYAKFIKRLSLGFDIYGFEFSLEGKPMYVLWREKNKVVNISMNFPPITNRVKVTDIITDFGKKEPRVDIKTLQGGKLELELTTNPIFVEPSSK
jgi:hypothetical protein